MKLLDVTEWCGVKKEYDTNTLNTDICSAIKKLGVIPLQCKIKIIFNKPATILIIDNKKYVSKASEEEFDKEKGLLMCLVKAFGITYPKIKKMVKNATDQSNKKIGGEE